jgi:uncharacterized Zn finger protein
VYQQRTSIAQRQVKATLRAIEEAGNYTVTITQLQVREHSGRSYSVPVARVEKQDGTQYQVTVRPQGVPTCTCPASQQHRGQQYSCKHCVLVTRELRKQQMEQERLERLNSDFALTEAEIEAMSEDLHLLTDAEKPARTLKDRELWD